MSKAEIIVHRLLLAIMVAALLYLLFPDQRSQRIGNTSFHQHCKCKDSVNNIPK